MALITIDEAMEWGKHGELCDLMTVDDQRQVAEWLDELVRLRAARDAWQENDADLRERNAKLRELVDYMTPIAWYAASERERNRLRELGVEADG